MKSSLRKFNLANRCKLIKIVSERLNFFSAVIKNIWVSLSQLVIIFVFIMKQLSSRIVWLLDQLSAASCSAPAKIQFTESIRHQAIMCRYWRQIFSTSGKNYCKIPAENSHGKFNLLGKIDFYVIDVCFSCF